MAQPPTPVAYESLQEQCSRVQEKIMATRERLRQSLESPRGGDGLVARVVGRLHPAPVGRPSRAAPLSFTSLLHFTSLHLTGELR